MLNDGTCFRRNIFSSPRHRWPFKLKSHYNQTTCCLPVMGKSQCIAEIVILSPSQRTPMVKSSTILNPSLIFFVRKVPPLLTSVSEQVSVPMLCLVEWYTAGLSCALIWQSRVQSSVSPRIFEIQFTDIRTCFLLLLHRPFLTYKLTTTEFVNSHHVRAYCAPAVVGLSVGITRESVSLSVSD